MDTPAQLDLTIYRGRDFSQQIELQQDDGTPVNLTGYTVKSEIRAQESQSSALLGSLNAQITDAAAGKVTLAMTDTETAAIATRTAYYDVLFTSPGGIDETWVRGTVTTEGTVTKK